MKARHKQPKEPTSTKEKKQKRTKVRLPRPMGVTALCQEYNKGLDQLKNPSPPQNKDILYKKIQRLYINALMNQQLIEYDYITKDYKLLTIQRLSYLLNTDTNTIMIMIANEMSRMGLVMDRQKAELARGATLGLFFEASELSALTRHQTAILLASQGSVYRPFISGEVNRSIANQIAAMKPKLDLLKLLLDKQSSLSGPALPAEQKATEKGTLMTIEMAHNLLNDGANSVMTNGALLDDILTKDNDLKLIPETNPNYQGGDILSSKSLYKGTNEELQELSDKGTHTDKLQAKRGIEEPLDEEDFTA